MYLQLELKIDEYEDDIATFKSYLMLLQSK